MRPRRADALARSDLDPSARLRPWRTGRAPEFLRMQIRARPDGPHGRFETYPPGYISMRRGGAVISVDALLEQSLEEPIASTAGPVLEAHGIVKTYRAGLWPRRRSVPLLRAADIDLWPSEVVGLVGENGCGAACVGEVHARLRSTAPSRRHSTSSAPSCSGSAGSARSRSPRSRSSSALPSRTVPNPRPERSKR